MNLLSLSTEIIYMIFGQLSVNELKILSHTSGYLTELVDGFLTFWRKHKAWYLRQARIVETVDLVTQPMDRGSVDPTVTWLLYHFTDWEINACAAGGYPSFVMGKTDWFNDVDVFLNLNISKSEAYDMIRRLFNDQISVNQWPEFEARFHHYENTVIKINTIVSAKGAFGNFHEIQFIFVSVKVFENVDPQLFALEVLESFDMHICKTALVYVGEVRCINLAVPNKRFLRSNIREDIRRMRIEKYNDRDLVTSFSPNSLKSLCFSKVLEIAGRWEADFVTGDLDCQDSKEKN